MIPSNLETQNWAKLHVQDDSFSYVGVRGKRFPENRTNINTCSLRQNASCASFFLRPSQKKNIDDDFLWMPTLPDHSKTQTLSYLLPEHQHLLFIFHNMQTGKKQNLFGYVENLDKICLTHSVCLCCSRSVLHWSCMF